MYTGCSWFRFWQSGNVKMKLRVRINLSCALSAKVLCLLIQILTTTGYHLGIFYWTNRNIEITPSEYYQRKQIVVAPARININDIRHFLCIHFVSHTIGEFRTILFTCFIYFIIIISVGFFVFFQLVTQLKYNLLIDSNFEWFGHLSMRNANVS